MVYRDYAGIIQGLAIVYKEYIGTIFLLLSTSK